jgi:hypothetical protein
MKTKSGKSHTATFIPTPVSVDPDPEELPELSETEAAASDETAVDETEVFVAARLRDLEKNRRDQRLTELLMRAKHEQAVEEAKAVAAQGRFAIASEIVAVVKSEIER